MVTLIPKIHCFHAVDDLFEEAAHDFCRRAQTIVKARGVMHVVLSGGNTPKAFFNALIQDEHCLAQTPWQQLRFFFSDERYVPTDHPDNNYRMVDEFLLSRVGVPKEHVYPMPTHFADPNEAAQAYEATLRQALETGDDAWPSFDLTYLGLGDDGHTASLFPGTDVLQPGTQKWVEAVWVPRLNTHRLTLTVPVINRSEDILFMATGDSKAHAVKEVLTGASDSQRYPAQLISRKATWFLDQAASALLD